MRISLPGIGGSLGECVLCGESFCKEILLGQSVPMIHVDGFDRDLPIHKEKCLPALESNGPDWHNLPEVRCGVNLKNPQRIRLENPHDLLVLRIPHRTRAGIRQNRVSAPCLGCNNH